jgi:hypothetical protein
MPIRTTSRTLPPAGDLADGGALNAAALSHDVRLALQQLEVIQQLAAAGRCHAITLCEALTEAGRALASVHAYSLSESCLTQALHCAALLTTPDLSANLLCALAEVTTNAAELARWRGDAQGVGQQARSRARRHAHEAAALAGGTSDPRWELKLLLRASDVLDRCGQHDEAMQMQQRAMLLLGLHATTPADAGAPPASPAHDALRLAAPAALM